MSSAAARTEPHRPTGPFLWKRRRREASHDAFLAFRLVEEEADKQNCWKQEQLSVILWSQVGYYLKYLTQNHRFTIVQTEEFGCFNNKTKIINQFELLSRACFSRYLIKFLSKLTEYQDVNKMTPGNIAIVLGPNLLWTHNEGGYDCYSYS